MCLLRVLDHSLILGINVMYKLGLAAVDSDFQASLGASNDGEHFVLRALASTAGWLDPLCCVQVASVAGFLLSCFSAGAQAQ